MAEAPQVEAAEFESAARGEAGGAAGIVEAGLAAADARDLGADADGRVVTVAPVRW